MKKQFAFLIPHKLIKTLFQKTEKQYAWYWINDDKLITCHTFTSDPGFVSCN